MSKVTLKIKTPGWFAWKGDYKVVLDYYEQQVERWLKKEGYLREWNTFKDFDWDWPPDHIKDLVIMSQRILAVRGLATSDPEQALWHMAMVYESAQRAGMPEITQKIVGQLQRKHAQNPRNRQNPLKEKVHEVFRDLKRKLGIDPPNKILERECADRGVETPTFNTLKCWRSDFVREYKKSNLTG